MPDTDNNELMSQNELEELLKSFSDDEDDNNADTTNKGKDDNLKDLLDKSDDDLSDDDLESLVNMLNRTNDLTETKFNNTYSDGFEENDEILEASAESLFSDADEVVPEILKTQPLPSVDETGASEKDQVDQDDIDLLLSNMPVSKVDLNQDVDPFVKNVSVYDGVHPEKLPNEQQPNEQNLEVKPEKEKKPPFDVSKIKFVAIIINFIKSVLGKFTKDEVVAEKKPPSKIIYIIIGVMGVLVLVSGFLMFNTVVKLNKLKTETTQNHMLVTNNAQTMVNNSNFIYTSISVPWNGWDFTLKKMLLDSEATMFYFDRLMNIADIDVTLTDEAGQLYGLDLSYYSDTLTSETKATVELRFQPVPEGTTKFTLNIYDLTSKEVITFPIELSSPVKYMPVKYLSEPMEIDLSDNNTKLIIEDAVFASSGTTISYKTESSDGGSTILFADSEYINSKSLSISGMGKEATPVNIFPTQYSFLTENVTIGRMTFSPLVSLTGNVTINLKNMFKKVTKNTMIDVTDLFLNKEEYQITINSAPYKVVLERIGQFGTIFVVVYHAETATISQKQMDESISLSKSAGNAADEETTEADQSKRLQAKISATLLISLKDGSTIEVEGTNLYNNIGGEIHFFTKDIEGLPSNVSKKDVSLRINEISFRMPDTSVRLDLSTLKASRKSNQFSLVSNFITMAFDSRLRVKSGEEDESVLSDYFSSEVIGNAKLSEAYAPLAAEGSAQYTSQVITLAGKTEKKYLAVVGVTWNGVVDGKEIHFYRTHKLTIEYQSTGWVITQDEVV